MVLVEGAGTARRLPVTVYGRNEHAHQAVRRVLGDVYGIVMLEFTIHSLAVRDGVVVDSLVRVREWACDARDRRWEAVGAIDRHGEAVHAVAGRWISDRHRAEARAVRGLPHPAWGADRFRCPVAVVGMFMGPGRWLLVEERSGSGHDGVVWDFPMVALEGRERLGDVLERRMPEMLGVQVRCAEPMMVLRGDADRGGRTLGVYLIHRWRGDPRGMKGQTVGWAQPRTVLAGPSTADVALMVETLDQRHGNFVPVFGDRSREVAVPAN